MAKTKEQRQKHAAYMREWNAKNKDKAAANHRRTYAKHRDKILARNRAYKELHPPDKEYHRSYYAAHRDEILQRTQEWSRTNKRRINAQRALYRQENKETLKARNQDYYARNKERCAEKAKEYLRANYDKIISKHKKYQAQHPEKLVVWRLNSKTKRRMRVNKTVIPFNAKQLDERLSMFGYKCWMCGRDGQEVDHVIPLARGGIHALSNLRPACRTCNRRKGSKHPREIQIYKAA